METTEELHIDILIFILLRLPALSLLRFKSVCKTWYNLITSPEFARRHLQQSLTTQTNYHFICRKPTIYMGTFPSGTELKYPYMNIGSEGGASIIGSCNGLLCLWNYYQLDKFNAFLFNPTTRTHKMIPLLPRPSQAAANLKHMYIYGFGFDGVANDFKFVRIILCPCEETGLSSYSQTMVYSLSSNLWTEVLDHVPILSDCRRVEGVYVSGNLHWVNHTPYFHRPFPIVSFNLTTHTFGEVPVPEVHVPAYCFMHVGQLEGCLSVVIRHKNEFEILIMKEYGVVGSWTRLIRFPKPKTSDVLHRPIAFKSSKRKKLLVGCGRYLVFSIDMKKKVMEEVTYPGFGGPMDCETTTCVENLLMLEEFSEGENSRRRNIRYEVEGFNNIF